MLLLTGESRRSGTALTSVVANSSESCYVPQEFRTYISREERILVAGMVANLFGEFLVRDLKQLVLGYV